MSLLYGGISPNGSLICARVTDARIGFCHGVCVFVTSVCCLLFGLVVTACLHVCLSWTIELVFVSLFDLRTVFSSCLTSVSNSVLELRLLARANSKIFSSPVLRSDV